MKRTRRLLAIALALLFVVLGSIDAAAESGATLVALVTAEPDAPLTRRVRAELEGLGVDVIVLRPPGEQSPSREPLEIAARNVGATAAVRIIPSQTTTEVWVADRATGKTVIRELSPKAPSDAAVAIGAVELLRASLMELHATDGAQGQGEVKATEKLRALALPVETPVASAAPARVAPRLGLAVGAGVDVGVRGALSPEAAAAFALWVAIYGRVGARAFASLMWSDDAVTAAGGTARVRTQLFGAELTYDVLPSDGDLVPIFGFGVATTHATAAGDATAPYVGSSVDTWRGGPLAHVGLGVGFAPGLRLRADAAAAWALTPPRVRIANEDMGTIGAPTVFLSVAFELLWGR